MIPASLISAGGTAAAEVCNQFAQGHTSQWPNFLKKKEKHHRAKKLVLEILFFYDSYADICMVTILGVVGRTVDQWLASQRQGWGFDTRHCPVCMRSLHVLQRTAGVSSVYSGVLPQRRAQRVFSQHHLEPSWNVQNWKEIYMSMIDYYTAKNAVVVNEIS